MSNSCDGVVDNHSWSCPAHYGTDLLAHIGFIAMDRAAFTCWFLLAKFATVKAFMGVGDKCFMFVVDGGVV